MYVNPNCISQWFPRLESTGVPVPETYIVQAPRDLVNILDGRQVAGWSDFIKSIADAAERVGFPFFLRAGTYSAKHGWRDTCFVPGFDQLEIHVARIVDNAGCVDQPVDVWAVRRFIPLMSTFTAFRGMPVSRERRYFAQHGQVICRHPYWAEKPIGRSRNLPPGWRDQLAEINVETEGEIATLTAYAKTISLAFDGPWSIDFAQAQTGQWLCIDMAEAESSYHEPSCQYASDEMRQAYG